MNEFYNNPQPDELDVSAEDTFIEDMPEFYGKHYITTHRKGG